MPSPPVMYVGSLKINPFKSTAAGGKALVSLAATISEEESAISGQPPVRRGLAG